MDKKKVTAIICAIGIWMHFTFITGIVSGPTFMRIFSLSKTQLGLMMGAGSIGVLMTASMAGHMVSRAGAGKVLIIGLAMAMASVFTVIFSLNFYMIVTCFVFAGVANALLLNANTTILSEFYPAQIRRIIALYSALYFGSSAVFAPFLGKWLNTAKINGWDTLSFRIPYALIFVVFIFILSASLKIVIPFVNKHFKHKQPQRQKKVNIPGKRTNLFAGGFWIIAVMGFLHNIMVATVLAWANPMAQYKFSSNEFKGALFVSMITVGIATGRFLIAGIRLLWDDRKVLSFGTIAGGILTATGLLSHQYNYSIIFVSAGSFISSVSYPCITSIAGRFFAHSRAKAFGYMFTGFATAGLVGPAIIGRLGDAGLSLWHALLIGPLSAFILGGISAFWKTKQPQALL